MLKKELNTKLPTVDSLGFKQESSATWTKELGGQIETFKLVDWKNIPELEEVVDLQQKVWGMGPRDAVPSNLLAIAGDTGGAIITAKNSAGELEGFVFTMGMTDGSLILHMIGVEENKRYKKDLGWNLSVLQMLEAQKNGVKRIVWTFDPMRGSNARLNLEKLGAVVDKYTVNKYGKVESELYGESPTDRFTAKWEIDSPRVAERIHQVGKGEYRPLSLNEVNQLQVLYEPLENWESTPDKFLVEIPYDIDNLPEEEKVVWRMNLRNILTSVLDTETAQSHSAGHFSITGLATGRLIDSQDKQSFYVLSKKG
jgi:chorismate synthase